MNLANAAITFASLGSTDKLNISLVLRSQTILYRRALCRSLGLSPGSEVPSLPDL